MTLFDLVNTRYEAMLTTIYTSQYSLPALQERLSRAHETETAKQSFRESGRPASR